MYKSASGTVQKSFFEVYEKIKKNTKDAEVTLCDLKT